MTTDSSYEGTLKGAEDRPRRASLPRGRRRPAAAAAARLRPRRDGVAQLPRQPRASSPSTSAAWSWSSRASGSATTSAVIRWSRAAGGRSASSTGSDSDEVDDDRQLDGRHRRHPGSPSTQPDRVGKLSPSAAWAGTSSAPGPGEGINLLMEFTDDPTRERLIAWLHSMVFDPRPGDRGADRGTLDAGHRPEHPRQRPHGCTAGRRSRPWRQGRRSSPTRRRTGLSCTRSRRRRCSRGVATTGSARVDMAIMPMRSIPERNCTCSPTAGTGR